jgi:hypothetical protein
MIAHVRPPLGNAGHRLIHRKCPCAPLEQNDMSRRTVESILRGSENRNLNDDLEQQ